MAFAVLAKPLFNRLARHCYSSPIDFSGLRHRRSDRRTELRICDDRFQALNSLPDRSHRFGRDQSMADARASSHWGREGGREQTKQQNGFIELTWTGIVFSAGCSSQAGDFWQSTREPTQRLSPRSRMTTMSWFAGSSQKNGSPQRAATNSQFEWLGGKRFTLLWNPARTRLTTSALR